MNRNFLLVFILLAMLSVVNARPHALLKRQYSFQPCPVTPTPDLLTITVDPDPVIPGKPATFHVSGTPSKDHDAGLDLVCGLADPSTSQPIGTPGVLTLPALKSGTKFSEDVKIDVDALLAPPYIIGCAVVDPNNSNAVIMCAGALSQ